MHFDHSRTALTLAAVFAICTPFVVACSSAPPSDSTLGGDLNQNRGGNANNGSTNGSRTPSNNDSSQSSDPTDPADPAAPGDPANPGDPQNPAPTGACGTTTSFDACFDCCDTQNPGGFEAGDKAFGDCACQTPGVCAQACGATFCAGKEPDQACITCLEGATQCETAAETACNGNPACQAAVACYDSSGCEQKP